MQCNKHLLVQKPDVGHITKPKPTRNRVRANLARLNITLIHDNILGQTVRNRDLVALAVQVEMPRLHAAARDNLDEFQLARLERLERDNGIALNLRLVLRIRIRHREHGRQPV